MMKTSMANTAYDKVRGERTLHELMKECIDDGFPVEHRIMHMEDTEELYISIPEGRAIYSQYIQKIMNVGGFEETRVQNNVEQKMAQIVFSKSLKV